MAMIACPECSKEVSSAAVACPSCAYPVSSSPVARKYAQPAPKPESAGMGTFAKILLWIVGLFVAFIAFGAMVGSSPEAKERAEERRTIEYCWDEQKKKSLAPDTQRFVAGACERLEDDFRKKWNRNP